MLSLLKRHPRLVLLPALLIYFGIGAFNLHLPGLQYDEAADAVPALEMLRGWPVSSLSTFHWFGREWPLMMLHHIGPASIYTSLMGFALLGVSVESLRLAQLCVGTLSLLLLFKLSKDWFGQAVASIAVLACASAPAFIWWNRAGANWTAPLLPHALGMLLALAYWWRSDRSRPGARWALVLAAFLLGAGFTTKILFVWLLAPLGLTALVAGPRRVGQALRATGWLTLALAALALLLGLAPFIAHNIPNGDTFRFILSNAAQTRIYGHNNLDFGNNLVRVLNEYARMLGGDTLHFQANFYLPVGALLWIGALIVGVFWLRSAERSLARCFLWFSQVAVLPLSTISTSSIGATYVFILVPFAWLLVAVAIWDGVQWFLLRNRLKPRLSISSALIVLPMLLIVANLATNIYLLQFLNQTGGRGFWSDAIFELATTLETRYAGRPVRAMDWGFSRNIALLTQKRVDIQDRFELAPKPSQKFEDLCTVMLRDEPQNVFLFHTPETMAFPGAWEVLNRSAQKLHQQLVLQNVLYERDGITNTLIYTAQPAPRQFGVPMLPNPRNATVGPDRLLLGGEVQFDPKAHEVAVRLFWQAKQAGLPDDTILLHVVNQANGEVMQNGDHRPIYDTYPFPQWQAGEVVTDPYWIKLPADLPPGVYQIRVGAYDHASGQRREITDPRNDAAGNSLMLETFEVK